MCLTKINFGQTLCLSILFSLFQALAWHIDHMSSAVSGPSLCFFEQDSMLQLAFQC